MIKSVGLSQGINNSFTLKANSEAPKPISFKGASSVSHVIMDVSTGSLFDQIARLFNHNYKMPTSVLNNTHVVKPDVRIFNGKVIDLSTGSLVDKIVRHFKSDYRKINLATMPKDPSLLAQKKAFQTTESNVLDLSTSWFDKIIKVFNPAYKTIDITPGAIKVSGRPVHLKSEM